MNPRTTGALSRGALTRLIQNAESVPLIAEYKNLTKQLQPNGFDVTVRSVAAYADGSVSGAMGVQDEDRALPEPAVREFGSGGWLHLPTGQYLVTFNEIVNLPRWLMALARPRSSLLRMGVTLHTAVWDAGYSGRSQALLVVHNPAGFRLQRDSRIAQMVFFSLNAPDDRGYDGRYQGENL